MKNKIHKINLGATRKKQKEEGYFDGRFVEKAEKLKNKYKRNKKHKNKGYGEYDED